MDNIRNFTIIAHINHGKSTLADRFLELTKTIKPEEMKPQFLNTMDLERGKGITIKMHPVRMLCRAEIKNSKLEIGNSGSEYILNLIDTPGHVDFSYEVSRSLAAVESAVLLVDATKGIQAQTIYNLELAKKQNLVILAAVNKIDVPEARVDETKKELSKLLEIPESEILAVSAKEGWGRKELLEKIIEITPPPKIETEAPFKALIFDSKYDSFKGIIVFVRIFAGKIKAGEKIHLIHSKIESEIKEVGFFSPELNPSEELKAGEIGYIATGIKEAGKVGVGDTIIKTAFKTQIQDPEREALPGYQTPKPVVFASLYPQDLGEFENLRDALLKLKLNDPSFTFEPETREGLGRGFRCGFLGNLHIEIVTERLRNEFGLELVISTPSVIYKIIDQKEKETSIFNPADWPESFQIKEVQEPWSKLEVLTPTIFLGQVLKILEGLEGKQVETKYFSQDRVFLIYEVPLREIIAGFFDKLKSQTKGFASMNYEILGYRKGDLLKLEILIAGKKEEALSRIVPRDKAFEEGKRITQKLKEILPPQLFSVAIQATVGGKVIARETMRAKGRDVIAPLYGGDYTRKRKLLEQQKKGKKELKAKGEVRIPQEVFLEIFRS
jgi:GTP-binding protein LepA